MRQRVRQALNDPDRRIIKTVPRRGYLFAAPCQFGRRIRPLAALSSAPRISRIGKMTRKTLSLSDPIVENIARPVRVYALPAAAVASTPLVEVPPHRSSAPKDRSAPGCNRG